MTMTKDAGCHLAVYCAASNEYLVMRVPEWG